MLTAGGVSHAAVRGNLSENPQLAEGDVHSSVLPDVNGKKV